jgi:hypothetical protein
MFSVALPLSYRDNSRAGIEPATTGFEVSVTYATGQGGIQKNTLGQTTPGNERREFGTSALRCRLVQDYAPAPQSEPSGRVCTLLCCQAVEVTLPYRHRR